MPGIQDGSTVASTSSSAPASAHAAAKPTAPDSVTLFVSYGQRSVKARIDKEVPLEEILRQLVGSSQLGIMEPASLFALRTEQGELVTEANLIPLLEKGLPFVLTSSPTLEAAELVEKLQSSEPAVLKLATFSLRSLIKEDSFLREFGHRGGLNALQDVIRRSTGNTLAYALLSLQNLITDERGWDGLEPDFAERIVEIIAKEPLINISRPATALLQQLTQSTIPISFASESALPGETQTGFAFVYREIAKQPDFMKIVVGRLSSGDVPVATLSLALINSLFKGATDMGDLRFGDELEKLEVSKVVGKLLESQRSGSGDITSLLAFQGNFVVFLHLCLKATIAETAYPLFDDAWLGAGLSDGDETFRWRKLGFLSEQPQDEFSATGLLGLKALASFGRTHSSDLTTAVHDQASRPEDRRCPIATVSSTVLLLLAEHFDILHGSKETPTVPQPFLLGFYEAHALATLFFIRMWHESGATRDDFERVATLTRSQIAFVFNQGLGDKSWFKVKQEFLQTEYKTVRDRQMREADIEDDIVHKAPVRNLRGRLYRESYEFVRNQRISCLLEGGWFRSPTPSQGLGRRSSSSSTPAKPWRFYRLAGNRKVLHYVESAQRTAIRNGLEDLPERIEVSSIIEIQGAGAGTTRQGHARSPSSTSFRNGSHVRNSSLAQPLSFALVSAEGVIAELVAPDQHTYAEWVDGLSLLNAAEGSITTRETADFVQILTEVGVKIKLLDLSGEKVDIPANISVSGVPASSDFFYSDYSLH